VAEVTGEAALAEGKGATLKLGTVLDPRQGARL
jgi:hypothetical protein